MLQHLSGVGKNMVSNLFKSKLLFLNATWVRVDCELESRSDRYDMLMGDAWEINYGRSWFLSTWANRIIVVCSISI